MWKALRLAGSIAVLSALLSFVGCGGNDLVLGGMPLPVTPTPTPGGTCLQTGDTCVLSSDCCSGQCVSLDQITLTCQ